MEHRAQDVGTRVRQAFLPKDGERLDVPTSFLGASLGHQNSQGRKLGVLRPSRLVQVDEEVLSGFVESGAVPSFVDEGIPPEWAAAPALALQVGRERRSGVMNDLNEQLVREVGRRCRVRRLRRWLHSHGKRWLGGFRAVDSRARAGCRRSRGPRGDCSLEGEQWNGRRRQSLVRLYVGVCAAADACGTDVLTSYASNDPASELWMLWAKVRERGAQVSATVRETRKPFRVRITRMSGTRFAYASKRQLLPAHARERIPAVQTRREVTSVCNNFRFLLTSAV